MTDQDIIANHPGTRQRYRLRLSWFPSLFFGDGMVWSVLTLTLMMLRRFGLGNVQATMYVALMCLPFAMRPLLEMVVTHFKGTTKVWILSAEFISALSLWAIAFILPTTYWLQGTICFLPFFVVSAILHNIVATRFYLSRMAAADQQSTFAMLFRCIALLFGAGAVAMLAGNMEVLTRNIRYSWSFVFYIMAGTEFFLWLWHSIFLHDGNRHSPRRHTSETSVDTFGLHRRQYRHVLEVMASGIRSRVTMAFFMFFALPEAFMSVAVPMFVIDAPHNGGLGLSPQEFGLTFGTIAIAAFFLGRCLGSYAISLFGARRCSIPMAIVAALHGQTMLYLSSHLATSLFGISAILGIGYASFGLGYTAYTRAIDSYAHASYGYLMRRAVILGLVAIVLATACMLSGMAIANIGYRQFFAAAVVMHVIALAATCAYTLATRGQDSNT